MVATRRTVRAPTVAQRQRRAVERATPLRPKRSHSVSTVFATRDAAGLPPRARGRRALLTTAAEPVNLRRSSSPARSSPDRGVSVDPPPALRQLSPLCRMAVEPSPVPAELTQWRRGIFDRLPCLDTVPPNHADLRAFLQAVSLAGQALDRPADTFHITVQQLHPRLQAHIRICMTAQPDPTRTPYEHMVAILIQLAASRQPRRLPASDDRPHRSQHRGEHRPHDDNTLTLNDDVYASPASPDPPAATPPAAPRAQATQPASRQQRTAPTPSELLQEPPPESWAAAIHHLNQQAPRALTQPSALNSLATPTPTPVPSLGPWFFRDAQDHGHRACPRSLLADCLPSLGSSRLRQGLCLSDLLGGLPLC
ncbi:hypothetical protein Emag_007007 [Eimeria magna]